RMKLRLRVPLLSLFGNKSGLELPQAARAGQPSKRELLRRMAASGGGGGGVTSQSGSSRKPQKKREFQELKRRVEAQMGQTPKVTKDSKAARQTKKPGKKTAGKKGGKSDGD